LQPLLDRSEDFGNPTDLKDVLAAIDVIPAPNPVDPRPHVGEAPGTVLGYMLLTWDGIGAETVSVQPKVTAGGKQVSFARIDNGQFQQDVAAVLNNTLLTFGVAVSNGDFDSDGDVDGADFVAWQTNFPLASGATLANGDADRDGDVDGADFVVWQTNFPFPSGGSAPLPEPSTAMLAVLGGCFLLARCFRRQ
jgi:hypothetical protein